MFVGCGSAVIAGSYIGFLGISLAFGFTVLVMVYAIGPISGCHINPAITIAMASRKKINLKDTIGYIIAQSMGAILGSAVLFAIASGESSYDLATSGLGQNGYEAQSPANYSLWSCFLAETVLTFIFLVVIFGATHEKANGKFAGLVIGVTLVIIHLVGIPITGTSVNPARSLGPAIFVGLEALSQLWLFWVAPVFGGLLAAMVSKVIFPEDQEV